MPIFNSTLALKTLLFERSQFKIHTKFVCNNKFYQDQDLFVMKLEKTQQNHEFRGSNSSLKKYFSNMLFMNSFFKSILASITIFYKKCKFESILRLAFNKKKFAKISILL